jgi:hypothetical protein
MQNLRNVSSLKKIYFEPRELRAHRPSFEVLSSPHGPRPQRCPTNSERHHRQRRGEALRAAYGRLDPDPSNFHLSHPPVAHPAFADERSGAWLIHQSQTTV